jgi:hypothetical protein
MFLTTNEVNQKMDRRTFITSTTAATVGLATNAILPNSLKEKKPWTHRLNPMVSGTFKG